MNDHSSPLLRAEAYDQPSVFQPENLMREGRRQRGRPDVPVPAVCLLDPDGDIVRHLTTIGQATEHPGWACYHTTLWTFDLDGTEVGVIGCAVGASFAVLLAEQLAVSGCPLLISVTSAGSITRVADPPYFVVIDRALRDEGASHHYLPPGQWSHAPAPLLALLDQGLSGLRQPVVTGATWTTDAPYRETADAIAHAESLGIVAVEMEAAALYAYATARRRDVICVAHVTNTMATSGADFEKGEADGARDALEVVAAVIDRLRPDGQADAVTSQAAPSSSTPDTDSDALDTSTAALLLDTLRQATGRSDLEFAAPPTPLSGGFYAEMVRFRLSGPPADLDRELVARIVPNPAAGAWEATIQREVAGQGFPTPVVRLVVDETSPLGRYLVVMDHVDGRPPMAGLGIGTVAGQIPNLVRHLPDQLARVAADLHALDPELLTDQLAALGSSIPTTTAGFVEEQAGYARALGRPDIAAAGEQLLATEPTSSVRVITHGDLHPFNLIITTNGPALVDWTVARVAHPGFTLGFTDLMLAHPPIPLPKAGTALLGPVARNIAKRFLATYRTLTAATSAAVDDQNLDWHRRVHALRIMVELAGWDANGTRPGSDHPWLILEPIPQRALGLRA